MRDLMQTDIIGSLESIGASFTLTSLALPPELSRGEWANVGHQLCAAHQSVSWWIADWVAFGNLKYGNISDFAELTGYTPDSLWQMGWAASRVKTFSRLKDLSFGHHVAVASLNDEDQKKWLERAAREGMTRAELRAAILADKAVENAKDSDGPSFNWPQDQPITGVVSWIKKQPADFWTTETRGWWKNYLRPLVEIYENL